ncbi:hypothetical protein ABZP36_008217 [Zizania latifolia]
MAAFHATSVPGAAAASMAPAVGGVEPAVTLDQSLDESHSSPGLHAAAGSGLAEECSTSGGCRTGMAKMTNAYDLPARKVIHTVSPKYAVKYHTAAENALSHCYRSCLELLIENGLERYGGWDGKKWLSDVYIMDTMSLEWMELSVTGLVPPPRCGHSATMIEKRLLIFGGRCNFHFLICLMGSSRIHLTISV